MSEIEVGEYIRTKSGHIGKLYKISVYKINNKDKTMYLTKFSVGSYGIAITDIVKHSHNIIDLIEVGDYVNGYKVISILDGFVDGTMEIKLSNHRKIYRTNTKKIKTILTKEQFAQNCYEMEER